MPRRWGPLFGYSPGHVRGFGFGCAADRGKFFAFLSTRSCRTVARCAGVSGRIFGRLLIGPAVCVSCARPVCAVCAFAACPGVCWYDSRPRRGARHARAGKRAGFGPDSCANYTACGCRFPCSAGVFYTRRSKVNTGFKPKICAGLYLVIMLLCAFDRRGHVLVIIEDSKLCF